MDGVAHLPAKQRRELFQETAARRGMTPAVIEKDFSVCWTLGKLFGSELQTCPGVTVAMQEDVTPAYARHRFEHPSRVWSLIASSSFPPRDPMLRR